jgi:cation:H+ antiporter
VLVLVAGGRLLVDGAVGLARAVGVTERVIGLTVVAVGTSMPELAASIVAAYRRHADIAIANIIGSNIFNILGILGVTALIHPLAVSPPMVASDLWWMLGISGLLYPLIRLGQRIPRWGGGVLLASYLVYLALLF